MFFREILNEDLGCASYVIADGDENARRMLRMLEAVGFRNLRGYLAGGINAWRAYRRDLARFARPQRGVDALEGAFARAAAEPPEGVRDAANPADTEGKG